MANYTDPYSDTPEFALKKTSTADNTTTNLLSRQFNEQTQWIVPVDLQQPALEQMQNDNVLTLDFQTQAIDIPGQDLLNAAGLDTPAGIPIPLGLPSVNFTLFNDILALIPDHLDITSLIGTIRDATNLACNFKIPVINVPVLQFLTLINIKDIINKLKASQPKNPFEFDVDKVMESIKKMIPDYNQILQSVYKYLFECDNHR